MATEWFNAGKVAPTPRGAWNANTAYTRLDIVTSATGRVGYIALKDVPAGTALSNTEYWKVIVDATLNVTDDGDGNVSVT